MFSQIKKYKKAMAEARSYDAWQDAALELDYLEGNVEWKETFASDLYNYELIYDRLTDLRNAHQRRDHWSLIRSLREGLHHDLGNMGNYRLYNRSHVGTKHLIEEYVNQVCDSLNYVCDQDMPEMPLKKKLDFFKDTAQSFGRPVLMLSGGATLGLFHLGVIKALWERGLLPQVITGSSIGALVAALVGTRTDAEMPSLFAPENLCLNAWKWLGPLSGIRGQGLMDQRQLEQCFRANLGELSFQEAYERSERSVNISVSPVAAHQKARLLNGYTSPYLLVWSAVLASCAVPMVFPPAQLMKKDRDGNLEPYMPKLRFVDGSVVSDLPNERLMHLYNVNFSIVSQTNPHIVPWLKTNAREEKGGILALTKHVAKSEFQFHGRMMFDYFRKRAKHEAMRQISGQAYNIMAQRYGGDVTIAPRYRASDYLRLTSNPTPELLERLILEGERATWPRIAMIRTHSKISKTLERCVQRLKQRMDHRRAELRVIAQGRSA